MARAPFITSVSDCNDGKLIISAIFRGFDAEWVARKAQAWARKGSKITVHTSDEVISRLQVGKPLRSCYN